MKQIQMIARVDIFHCLAMVRPLLSVIVVTTIGLDGVVFIPIMVLVPLGLKWVLRMVNL